MPGPIRGHFQLPGIPPVNWRSLRAIVLPLVVISVPVGLLLVLEFRSLDRFEAASAEILRRSAVQATEELSDRIVEEFPEHHARAAGGRAPDVDDGVPAGPSGASGPAMEAGEVASPGTLSVWHRPTTLGARTGSVLSTDSYFGLAEELQPGRSSDSRREGSGILVVQVRSLAEGYLPALVASMRPRRRSLLADSPLELSVLDDRGREIYRTGTSLGEDYVHEVAFPFLSSRREDLATPDATERRPWRVRAGYPGTTVADLARARTNHQRQLLFFVAIVAAAGIILTSRAIARELKVQKMRSDFVSGVSHDLKTPLASIQMFAETLASNRTRNEAKVQEYARLIGIEATKLGRLIHDMLDSNKIEAGIRRYPVEEVDLGEVVREAVAGFEPQLAEAGFTTEILLPGARLPFLGNRDGLRQALDNLVGNAIKFRDESRAEPDHHLAVRVRKDGDNAAIEVEDRGVGIPPSDRLRVFERFYRVVREPDTDAAGTGLGLAIVQHVVESHGGQVRVTGNRHGGSTFCIELPLWFSGKEGEPE